MDEDKVYDLVDYVSGALDFSKKGDGMIGFEMLTVGGTVGSSVASSQVASAPVAKVGNLILAPCQDIVGVSRDSGQTIYKGRIYHDPSEDIGFVYLVLDKLGYSDIGGQYNTPKDVLSTIKVGILESPKHGSLVAQNTTGYRYEPEAGYLGADRMVFFVEISGKFFRVVQNVSVVKQINDNVPPICKNIKLRMR